MSSNGFSLVILMTPIGGIHALKSLAITELAQLKNVADFWANFCGYFIGLNCIF